MLWPIIFFIGTLLAIIIGLILRLYFYKPDGKFSCGITYKFINMKKEDVSLLNKFISKYVHEIAYSNIFDNREKLLKSVSEIYIKFYKPRYANDGTLSWPSLIDENYLSRRKYLNLPDISIKDLINKTKNGEYDNKTKTYYAYGLTLSQHEIHLTYIKDKINLLSAYEIGNALIIAMDGITAARNEKSELHKKLAKIASLIQL